MPHQCLNCGRIIPKGSDEILKGCRECGGRKFMYVDKPLDDERRVEIKRKAERIREDILRRSDNELVELIREKGVREVSKEMGEGWVRVSEKDLLPPEEVGYEVVKPRRKHPTAQELLREIDRKTGFREEPPPPKRPERRKAKARRVRGVKRKRREKTPDVVTIVERGVYEIDVKKLLERSPIIVQKDGTYLIHLPSLFGVMEEEK